MALQAGDGLGEQLTLAEPLSEGATSTIWRAHHRGLHADVAVKVMHAHRKGEPVAAIRFVEEAKVAAQLRHPNILRVYDQGLTDDGDRYIVMELLEGMTLGRRLEGGPLPIDEAIHVIEQTGKALAAAHAQGVVHRDVKMGNLFLCDDEPLPFVKLLDFGLAKRLAVEGLDLTTTGSLLGTLPYMSPEQLAGEHVDARADLWALGVVAYLSLTAERPFVVKSISGLMQAQKGRDFIACSERRPEVPAALDGWFERSFAPRIEDRFQDIHSQMQAWREAWGLPARPARSSAPPPLSPTPVLAEKTTVQETRSDPPAADEPPPRARRRAALLVAALLGIGVIATMVATGAEPARRLEPAMPRVVPVVTSAPLPPPEDADKAALATSAPGDSSPAASIATTVAPAAAAPPVPRHPKARPEVEPASEEKDNTDERIEETGKRLGI